MGGENADMGGGDLFVGSLVNAKRAPIVEIRWPGGGCQMEITQAREHAIQILEACEAAISDALLLVVVEDEMGGSRQDAAVLINLIRERRHPAPKGKE
jgi:hypothetical protein